MTEEAFDVFVFEAGQFTPFPRSREDGLEWSAPLFAHHSRPEQQSREALTGLYE